MREEITEFTLDDDAKHLVRSIRRFDKGLIDYVLVYYVDEGSRVVPLVTFDFAHGFPHRDLRYLPENDKRRKKVLASKPLSDLYDESLGDIYRNWRKYYAEYVSLKVI